MPVLRVIDIETTGLAPPAEIIEFGRVDVVARPDGWTIGQPMSSLYAPLRGISPETMAVHHITPADVTGASVCTIDQLRQAIWWGDRPDVLVAHNCSFERLFIDEAATDGLPWICTHKCALRLWPDAPGHSNQILRYWRKHVHDPQFAMPPHRAAPDAFVTAHLLNDMLLETSVEQLVIWTAEPKVLIKVPFGKHRGQKWSEIPDDYLAWMTRQQDMDADVVWNAQRELERRS
jgi:exodeoxyribonuclease X